MSNEKGNMSPEKIAKRERILGVILVVIGIAAIITTVVVASVNGGGISDMIGGVVFGGIMCFAGGYSFVDAKKRYLKALHSKQENASSLNLQSSPEQQSQSNEVVTESGFTLSAMQQSQRGEKLTEINGNDVQKMVEGVLNPGTITFKNQSGQTVKYDITWSERLNGTVYMVAMLGDGDDFTQVILSVDNTDHSVCYTELDGEVSDKVKEDFIAAM